MTKMPTKEKQNFPPCNRAFTLRMMNPMSYQEGNLSPLDREIQPVVKKQIAKNIEGKKNSGDDLSSSSMSSSTSYQDSGLYDIDENGYRHLNVVGSPAREAVNGSKKNRLRSKTTQNGMMTRSYTSGDGFARFNRNNSIRSTLPHVRSRSTSKPSLTSEGSEFDITRPDPPRSASSLSRSKSLRDRERPKTALGLTRPNNTPVNNNGQTNTPKKSNTVNGKSKVLVKSNTIRSKPSVAKRTSISTKEKSEKLINGHSKTHRQEQSIEGDNVFNDFEVYKKPNMTSSRGSLYNGTMSSVSNEIASSRGNSSLENSFDSMLQLNGVEPSVLSNRILSKNDQFADKLSEICTVISEKYPGDFHILETLVEMQSSYETRVDDVNKVICTLEHNVHELNHRVRQTSRLTKLIEPLIKETQHFEKELQVILKAQNVSFTNTSEQFTQIPTEIENDRGEASGHEDIPQMHTNNMFNGTSKNNSPLEEIRSESNAIVSRIKEGIDQKHIISNGHTEV